MSLATKRHHAHDRCGCVCIRCVYAHHTSRPLLCTRITSHREKQAGAVQVGAVQRRRRPPRPYSTAVWSLPVRICVAFMYTWSSCSSASHIHICVHTCTYVAAHAMSFLRAQATTRTTDGPTSPLGYSPPSPMEVDTCPPTPQRANMEVDTCPQTPQRAAVSDDDRPLAQLQVAAPVTPGILDAAAVGGGAVRNAKRGRPVTVKFELKSPVCAPLELSDSD